MNNCCDSSYYRTPYNIRYQNLYCSLAQEADTNLQTVITSGWSYKKIYKEIPNKSKKTTAIAIAAW